MRNDDLEKIEEKKIGAKRTIISVRLDAKTIERMQILEDGGMSKSKIIRAAISAWFDNNCKENGDTLQVIMKR